MTKYFAMTWGDKVQSGSRKMSKNSSAINCASRPVRNIGILTIVTMMSFLIMGGSTYAQEKCSAQVTAILNDPEANKPPEYSGIWDAYECSSCEGVRVDLREYKFTIKHKDGKVGIVRDLDELNYRPIKLNGRVFSARATNSDTEGGVTRMNIEFSEDGSKFKGTVNYDFIIPGKRLVFGKLGDKDAIAKRRRLAEKRRNLSSKAVTLALQCLKKFEALNVDAKIKKIAELEAQLKTASAKLGSTQDNLKKAGSASGARLQILEIYAEDKLKSGQKSEACTLFRAIIMMNPDKADLLKKNGC